MQALSTFERVPETWARYHKVADSEVETTVYGQPDWTPEDWGSVAAYGDETGDLVGEYWFVVYSGPEIHDDGALPARETDTGRYTGFWTFDSDTVAGDNGMSVGVTGNGETMQAAREQAYGSIDGVGDRRETVTPIRLTGHTDNL